MTAVDIKIGCDPEGFLIRKDGRFISADGLFPGTKKEPFKLEKGAVQVDGVALEFNIDPASDADTFSKNIETVVTQIKEMISKVDKDLAYVFRPIANFGKVDWDGFSQVSKTLGCDPDYNYLGRVNPDPSEKIGNLALRTAAGHIHIGFTEDADVTDPAHFADCLFVAKGLYENSLLPSTTAQELIRLKYYGHSGAFRPKKYGVEYRAPSNLWVQEVETQKAAFNSTRKLFNKITGL